jgi:hypothetical protein
VPFGSSIDLDVGSIFGGSGGSTPFTSLGAGVSVVCSGGFRLGVGSGNTFSGSGPTLGTLAGSTIFDSSTGVGIASVAGGDTGSGGFTSGLTTGGSVGLTGSGGLKNGSGGSGLIAGPAFAIWTMLGRDKGGGNVGGFFSAG